MQTTTRNRIFSEGQPFAATTSAPSANGSAKIVCEKRISRRNRDTEPPSPISSPCLSFEFTSCEHSRRRHLPVLLFVFICVHSWLIDSAVEQLLYSITRHHSRARSRYSKRYDRNQPPVARKRPSALSGDRSSLYKHRAKVDRLLRRRWQKPIAKGARFPLPEHRAHRK